MSAVGELLSYIKSLSPEQVKKAINFLPQVISAIEEQALPDPQKVSLQNQ